MVFREQRNDLQAGRVGLIGSRGMGACSRLGSRDSATSVYKQQAKNSNEHNQADSSTSLSSLDFGCIRILMRVFDGKP